MVPRSDGKNYDTEAAVIPDNCVACGICVGACPTATPFRRQAEIVAGIELPLLPIRDLRERTLAAAGEFIKGRRLLVYACEHSGAAGLAADDTVIITLPCVGMLPPSFVDFALSRNLADGIALAACAAEDCHYRLGGEWAEARLHGQRDPYLRQRVDRRRLRFWRFRRSARGAREKALAEFRADIRALPKNQAKRSSKDG